MQEDDYELLLGASPVSNLLESQLQIERVVSMVSEGKQNDALRVHQDILCYVWGEFVPKVCQ